MTWLDTLAEIRKTDWSKVPEPERTSATREVIQVASYAAAAASVVPLPLIDAALLVPIHTTMVMTIGHVQGRSLSDAEAKRVALELGAVAGVTMAGRFALSALKKVFLPGLGGVLAAPASFAVTWALGQAAEAYFKDPSLSREDLKTVFAEAFREGKASYTPEDGPSESPEPEAGAPSPEPEPVASSEAHGEGDLSSDPERDQASRAQDSDAEAHPASSDPSGVRPKKRSL